MNLEKLIEIIKASRVEDTKLYLITRYVRPDIVKSRKWNNKYQFKVYQIDCNDEVRSYLYDSSIEQMNNTLKKNFDLVDYDILTDDSEHLFTYPIKNKIFSFSDVVTNQLYKTSPRVTSLCDIISDTESLWAYCVEYYNIDDDKKIFTFRKVLSNKIGVDEKAKSWIRTIFNTQSMQLALLKEETVNLDKQIDCVYYDETFYILKKACFEQIVGLQEEYKETAKKIAEKLISCGNINGGELLISMIDEKPSIHKKLLKIERVGSYKELNSELINSMNAILKQYGESLPSKDGKLFIKTEEDVNTILKALGDYHKKGEVSGIPYGTYAGKELQTVK